MRHLAVDGCQGRPAGWFHHQALVVNKALAGIDGSLVRHHHAVQQARLADGVGLRAHLARGQRSGDAAHGGQGHVFARGHGGGQRGRAFGFHGHQGYVVPAVALQAFGHAGQQAATAHR